MHYGQVVRHCVLGPTMSPNMEVDQELKKNEMNAACTRVEEAVLAIEIETRNQPNLPLE